MSDARGGMFQEPEKSGGVSRTTGVSVGVVVAIVVAVWVALSQHKPAAPGSLQPVAAYAAQLSFNNVAMSESTSLSGGKDTYIDGQIANHGSLTVTGVTVQVLFKNDEAMPPQVETVPVQLIRAREPYIDTEPVSAEPLKPGAAHDFRLTFENIGSNWNQAMPEIRVIGVQTQ